MESRSSVFHSYSATIKFFTLKSSKNDKSPLEPPEPKNRSSGGVLSRWWRDLRPGFRNETSLEIKRPPAVSITRSQSTYLTEGRGQRRKNGERRRYSFNTHGMETATLQHKRTRTNGFEVFTTPQYTANDVLLDNNTMMPSRSTPNLQQQSPSRESKHYAYQGHMHDGESPPPAPPVRDSSSLKSVKYGPGHEKFPSWPVPSAAETPQSLRTPPGGGSHRSKSWTDHTNYPKEKVVTYTRPYMKRQHTSHSQQKLKTVMERCEKIPPEVYDSRYDKMNDHLYLPHFDRDGKQLGDMDYMVPSPPERDICKPQLTQAELDEYARSYQEPPEKFDQYNHEKGSLTEAGLQSFIKYSRNYEDTLYPHISPKHDDSMMMHLHQKQLSYAQSEGYHSYVSSTDSTSTPFLDRLRRDSEAVVVRHSTTSWDDEQDNSRREGRDSVVTTSSGSASSSETLKWHGSMSDVSVASSSCTHLTSNKQLIAHSARVQTPQRHYSESVLYLDSDTEGWKDRENRNNSTNKLKLFPVNTYTVKGQEPLQQQHNNSNRLSTHSVSIAERISELEKQQKYSFLDPEKKHKVPDPTLRAIQKKALLSFYERHQTSNKNVWRSEPQLAQNLQPVIQPPPRIKIQVPSRRASSASDYASNNTSKRSSMASNRDGKITPRHQHSNSCGSLSANLLGPIIVGPSISLDDWIPEKPPERPPKNPHLRTAYPDLFHDQRVPSPDLPPPSPPTVLEDEVFHSDEPLPPPPTEFETSDWQRQFQKRLEENTKGQFAEPQVDTRSSNYVNTSSSQINQSITNKNTSKSRQSPDKCENGYSKNYERTITKYPPTTSKLVLNGSIAISQKVAKGDQFRAEPLRAQPLKRETRKMDIVQKKLQRASIAEAIPVESPPPLHPRQMRVNQSMRARSSESRTFGVSVRLSPPKDNKLKDPRPLTYSLSQSKASYLASRRERERIVPDSDTGSYKRTISPNGHSINETIVEPINNTKEVQWPTNKSMKDNILKNNNVNILRRASMNEKSIKVEKEETKAPLPDVLPVNAKLMSPRYLSRPSHLSLAPQVENEDIKTLSPKTPPASPPKSPFSPLRSTTLSSPPITSPTIPMNFNRRTSPPQIRPSLSPNTNKRPSPLRKISPLASPLRTSPQVTPSTSPKSSTPPDIPTSSLLIPEQPKLVESLQLIQRTEVVLRVNACTTDASSQTEKDEMSPTPLPTRKKLQEEIDCEKLSEDFISQLPTSDRLKDILVQGPDFKKPTDYVTGLFRLDVTSKPRPANSPFRSRTTTPSSSPPPTSSELNSIVPSKNSELISTVPKLEASPLSATSVYFTTSEPKAKFLTRYSQDMTQLNIMKDTKDLSQKKQELVNRLDRKLEVLRSEQVVVSEECRINDELGEQVESHVSKLARPHEASKFRLHIQEIGKITSLLLGLSGRLARAENALMTMSSDHEERTILESKRDKLQEQLEEAKKLKESIDKRSVHVSNILYKYLNSEEYADYDHFINMKAKLIMDSKEIADKIKLGEEQLLALKETLIVGES